MADLIVWRRLRHRHAAPKIRNEGQRLSSIS